MDGSFTALGGQSISYLGRLNGDGTVDTGFNPGANNTPYSLAVLADGKIVVGGQFTALGGQSRTNIGRLNADGTLDTSFNPGANYIVYSLAVQVDGKIVRRFGGPSSRVRPTAQAGFLWGLVRGLPAAGSCPGWLGRRMRLCGRGDLWPVGTTTARAGLLKRSSIRRRLVILRLPAW